MITIDVNGKTQSVDIAPDTPLLWALRDVLGLTGTKYGCGIGRLPDSGVQCGWQEGDYHRGTFRRP
ncbi:MAG: iorA [Proteobacteria bacterium]|nr:iorA [Pseudomonadota bacterium]